MTKRVEVIIIEENTVVHHTTSHVYEDASPYTIAVQAIINELTGTKVKPIPIAGPAVAKPAIPILPPTEKPVGLDEMKRMIDKDFGKSTSPAPSFNVQAIPTIKMSDVMKGK